MILEVALLKIKTAETQQFEAALPQAEKVIAQAKGYLSHELRRCIETKGRYLLLVRWETLEAHTVGFRESPLFQQWRGLIGNFFEAPPQVEHYEAVTAKRV